MQRNLVRIAWAAGTLVLLAVVGALAWAWYSSRLPSTYSVMDYGTVDYGGGAALAAHQRHEGLSIADLRGPEGTPDVRFTLTAQHARVRLPAGRTIDALTFNARLPGPELRVHQGDLVEVALTNKDVAQGVTIHWHGVDVPNAEDGVAGVTQDAVLPGERYTYRFRADQVGTFWYHSHQSSANEVARGLFGAFVIEPREPAAAGAVDLAVVAHDFGARPTLNANDSVQRRAVDAGTPVRLRLVNSNGTPQRFALAGVAWRVVAIDGTDLSGPTPLHDETLVLAGGGRYDVAFTMPASPVALTLPGTTARLAFSTDGAGDVTSLPPPGPDFDPASYGTPEATPFEASSRFDRRFTLKIGRKPGFLDGRPGRQWTINGHIYPDVPIFVVRRGDLVEVTIANDTPKVHPMHLHGHHALVLTHDGKPVSGSPWWTDTLDVRPHERYELAFRADNPGIWMDHCHNLQHAAAGLTMHVAYTGYRTPFVVGGHTHNRPE